MCSLFSYCRTVRRNTPADFIYAAKLLVQAAHVCSDTSNLTLMDSIPSQVFGELQLSIQKHSELGKFMESRLNFQMPSLDMTQTNPLYRIIYEPLPLDLYIFALLAKYFPGMHKYERDIYLHYY